MGTWSEHAGPGGIPAGGARGDGALRTIVEAVTEAKVQERGGLFMAIDEYVGRRLMEQRARLGQEFERAHADRATAPRRPEPSFVEWLEAWTSGYLAARDGVPNGPEIMGAAMRAFENSGRMRARRAAGGVLASDVAADLMERVTGR